MRYVQYTLYRRNPEATQAAWWQKAIFAPAYEYEMSLTPEEAVTLEGRRRISSLLLLEMYRRFESLSKAGEALSFSQAAEILRISDNELREDVSNGYIPFVGGAISARRLRSLTALKIRW